MHKGLIAATLILILLASGCGGGGASDATSGPSAASEPSTEFLQPGGPGDKYVTFGEEASAAEREAASKVLATNLKAREDAKFGIQCHTLDEAGQVEVQKALERIKATYHKKYVPGPCVKELRELAEPLVDSEVGRTDTLSRPISALRIKATSAYALYHGNDKNDYAMPMENVGGRWEVSSLNPIKLGTTP
jgi:hypothetical protein